MKEIGELGEKLTSQWLMTQGWVILARRWRCRWGEIDIIAQSNSGEAIAFVEVKTRKLYNWDEGGILAIDGRKQAKITQSALMFLEQYPHLALLNCRFDVALVNYQKSLSRGGETFPQQVFLGQPVHYKNYQLTLSQYIESAFESNEG